MLRSTEYHDIVFTDFATAKNLLGKRLSEAVLTVTHNICFGSKIRKLGIPMQTPVFLYQSGV